MWGLTRTMRFCFTPDSRGASAVSRRKLSMKESSKGQEAKHHKRLISSFDTWLISQVQFRPLTCPALLWNTSRNSFQCFNKLVLPSYSSPSWKTFKTCQIAFFSLQKSQSRSSPLRHPLATRSQLNPHSPSPSLSTSCLLF